MTRLEELALLVARRAPAERKKYVSDALIPWHIIEDIRAELKRLGVDYR